MIALIAAILSAVTFLCLFLGQRIAKDYAGAQTIVIYLIPTFFNLFIDNELKINSTYDFKTNYR